ncbi:MAG: alpha/beta hydrolase [Mycobacterium sp.]|uniref:alpha/beta hydrolase n=1 Tax=Mycobacterium sp. TaxID=1785 RepID=UPI003CA7F433
MNLDAEIAGLLPALNRYFPRVETMTGPQLRAVIRERAVPPPRPAPVGAVVDRTVPSPVGDIALRIYWPTVSSATSGPVPVVVFAHGGGFVFCDLNSHDELCRAMTNGIGAVVVSVDYRLAPESPWPAAAEDVYAVADWATQQAGALGADPDLLLVAGDSAGGNLAAVTALMARDRDWPAIAGQVLMYPVIAADFGTPSYQRFGVGYYNTAAAMAWYWDQYVPRVADRGHPYASPLRARLTGLPPAVVITAGCDPLCAEGGDYAKALVAAGVPTIHRDYQGAIHGFMTMAGLAICDRARKQAWADISALLSRSLE